MGLRGSLASSIVWGKPKQIFRVRDHFPESFSHAQSPQIVTLSDVYRVFFSTRQRDSDLLPISRVFWADFDKSTWEVLRVSEAPVISDGEIGTFDEHGVFPLSPFQLGSELYGFTSGWSRRSSVPLETAVGLVKFEDGWESAGRLGRGPVLAANFYDPHLVCDAFVARDMKVDGFRMYYISGKSWIRGSAGPERIYKIRSAFSWDLMNWETDGMQVIEDALGPDECQALPSVVDLGGARLMVFCFREALNFRENSRNAYRLGGAISFDGVSWLRQDSLFDIPPSVDSWDGAMRCYPNVSIDGNKIFLLYNGNRFGHDGFGLAVGQLA